MKKTPNDSNDGMRGEYDFAAMKGGVRGKYVKRLAEATNIVLLEDDVASAFLTDAAVNEALRAVIRAAAVVKRRKRGAGRTAEPTGAARR